MFSKAVKATITIPKRVSIHEKSLIVNDDDIDMRKKIKKWVKTLELALKATKLVLRRSSSRCLD